MGARGAGVRGRTHGPHGRQLRGPRDQVFDGRLLGGRARQGGALRPRPGAAQASGSDPERRPLRRAHRGRVPREPAHVSVLALIPARGGSKSIPRKNVRLLGGIPLLAWSIAAARESRRVARTVVSTDDPEIRELALAWGAEAPFLRPDELARDDTPDLPVFLHALDRLARDGFRPDVVV